MDGGTIAAIILSIILWGINLWCFIDWVKDKREERRKRNNPLVVLKQHSDNYYDFRCSTSPSCGVLAVDCTYDDILLSDKYSINYLAPELHQTRQQTCQYCGRIYLDKEVQCLSCGALKVLEGVG